MNNLCADKKGRADFKYISLFALCFLIFGFFSAILTVESASYSGLTKPPLSPPPALFAIVWSILYVLIGGVTGAVYSFAGECYDENVKAGLTYAILGFIVNLLWYPLFFGRGELTAALVDIIVLLALNTACIISYYRIKPLYGYLLIPYEIWLAFATYLNLGFIIVN